MGTISVNKLQAALSKARDIGIVEETFTISDCEVTLRNLTPDEYAAVIQSCEGLDNLMYISAYQKHHIARAIVAINGADLRGIDYVDLEEADKNGNVRQIKRELYQYLLDNLLNTWSKEAIFTAYRKFGDVVEMAERKSKNGINFLLAEETDEDKYRRLLIEAKELESEIPSSVITSVLRDIGFSTAATEAEMKRVSDDLAAIEPTSAIEPTPAPTPPVVQTEQRPRDVPPDPHATLQQAIAARRTAPEPVSAGIPVVEPKVQARAAEIASLEAADGSEVAEVRKHLPVDPKAVAMITDQPPIAGINPRFKPPPRA
jgi:hypothetical protein